MRLQSTRRSATSSTPCVVPGGASAGRSPPVEGDGFIAAGFRHQTSRAGDPTLHTHVLVANATRTPDGRWGALDGAADLRPCPYRRVPLPSPAAGRAHQTSRRRMGARQERVRGCRRHPPTGHRRVLDSGGPRSSTPWKPAPSTPPRAAQIAALDTRKAKVYDVDATALRADWAQRADDARLRSRRGRRPPRPRASPGSRSCGRSARCSTTSPRPKGSPSTRRPSSAVTWCGRSPSGMPDGGDVTIIEDLADAFLADTRLVEVGDVAGEPAGRPASCCSHRTGPGRPSARNLQRRRGRGRQPAGGRPARSVERPSIIGRAGGDGPPPHHVGCGDRSW